ncbi:MAG: L-threonylcarbamoyladenylate synthase [Defluviitaleaceae bacterium]|nr:L-threonylcarbamoyladenylate synthase [Defluviitaleaceae bacterium]
MDTTLANAIGGGPAATQAIKQAAEIIKNGGLVAFPTETVYGLGANALDPTACGKIYFAKGRPSDNPLIVHINKDFDISTLAKDVPKGAQILMDNFWPGALTIILKATNSGFAYGYEGTIALRVPNNITARLLIHHSGVPIAAPSANTSGSPSPTSALHVMEDLAGKVDMVLDGGPCRHGLESTVVDFTGDTPKILRPGAVTREMIRNVIGDIDTLGDDNVATPKSPGTKYKHYAPKCKVTLVVGDSEEVAAQILQLLVSCGGTKPAVMASTIDRGLYGNAPFVSLGSKPEEVAANLFEALRQCDALGYDEVFVPSFSQEGIGLAIMNRLKKAAYPNIIDL